MNLPQARTADLLEQEADGELLIYDLRIDKAYNLNETLKIVFKACNGQTPFTNLERKHKYTVDLIHLALQELHASNLLKDYRSDHFAGLSRRDVIKRVGLATMTALPVIVSLSAPKAANAASTCGSSCTGTGECPSTCQVCRGSGTCVIGLFGTRSGSCSSIGARCTTNGTCIGGFCSNDGSISCRSSSRCTNFDGICSGTGTCQT